jgi:7,8-dihydro-6-hydroxymethylpterin dimethyltransferase
MIGEERLKANLGLIINRIADREIPKDLRRTVEQSLLGLFSEQSSLSAPSVGALRRMLGERVARINVKTFMDISTMIEERFTQCCVYVGTRSDTQDQCAPFCAVQAWPALGAQRLSTAVRTGGAR